MQALPSPTALVLRKSRFDAGHPAVMGIVNITEDSIWAPARTTDHARAARIVGDLVAGGADIVDVGGVRAGQEGRWIDAAEEIDRVRPALAAARAAHPSVLLSLDTWRAEVADACADYVDLVNDTWAGADPELAAVAARIGAGYVVSHTGGLPPRTDPVAVTYPPEPDGVVDDVLATLRAGAQRAVRAGVDPGAVVLDPTLDFGKTTAHSLRVLRATDRIVALGYPVMQALSRKDFVGETLDLPVQERLEGTLAATAVAAWLGTVLFRAHDVAATRRVVDMVASIRGDRPPTLSRRGTPVASAPDIGFSDVTQSSGIDLDALDPATSPAHDLYRHVNGRWIDTYQIPADRARDGAFRRLHDEAEAQVRDIITESPAGTKIGDLYASFLDLDTVEARGLAPLTEEILALGVDSKDELAYVMGRLEHAGSATHVAGWIDTDADDPSQYAVYFMQSGLGLPDEAYYREDVHADSLAAYRRHVQRMFTLAGANEHAALAELVVAFETELARNHWDVVTDRDAVKTHNPTTWDEFKAAAPGYNWEAWLEGSDAEAVRGARVIVREPSYFTGFAELWASTDIEVLRAWIAYHLITARAPLLGDTISKANFDFYGTTLTGAPEQRERWKRGVALVEGSLGDEVGRVYVERHFPPASKARVEELVTNLLAAYRESIESLDWMSAETKERALEKLGKFTPKIGYPVKWKSYDGLEIAPDDLYGNAQRVAAFTQARELRKLGGPVDRDEWFMNPQTVNAYYNPGMNEIVFPAAILQPPFFTADADDAVNYGGIGAVIGHEIGHGFDDQGSQYDGDGRLRNWWTALDRAKFEERTSALIGQFSAYSPAQLATPHYVNGGLTIGENIGDLGGLGIAIKAYRIATGDAEPPVIDGLTGMQRLLLGYAQVWQAKSRDAEVVRLLSIDPHSPPEFRCNGIVRNIDAYYAAFGVGEDSPWYLAPADRVTIW